MLRKRIVLVDLFGKYFHVLSWWNITIFVRLKLEKYDVMFPSAVHAAANICLQFWCFFVLVARNGGEISPETEHGNRFQAVVLALRRVGA